MSSPATRVAIVGGAGKVARLLLPALLADGVEAVSLARRDAQLAELREAGAAARRLDIEEQGADDFAAAFEGCDAVVFSAGGGPDGNVRRKQTVDLEGSLKSIEGARAAGIERFVQVSAIGVDGPVADGRGEAWAACVAAKRDADAALRASGLAWTILRPGGLLDEAGTGSVALANKLSRGSIPRADVAAVIGACLRRPDTVGHQWELTGGDTPIDAALDAAVA